MLFLLEEGGNVHLARVPAAGGPIERVLNGEREINAFDLGKTGDIAILESHPQQPAEVSFLARTTGRADAADAHVNDEFLRRSRSDRSNASRRRAPTAR